MWRYAPTSLLSGCRVFRVSCGGRLVPLPVTGLGRRLCSHLVSYSGFDTFSKNISAFPVDSSKAQSCECVHRVPASHYHMPCARLRVPVRVYALSCPISKLNGLWYSIDQNLDQQRTRPRVAPQPFQSHSPRYLASHRVQLRSHVVGCRWSFSIQDMIGLLSPIRVVPRF